MKYLNTRGDTIVEVLLAMVIVSAVLGGAYASSNRSLNAARQSQERGEALKLVEGQLELLKAQGKPGNAVVYTGPSPFCIEPGSNSVRVIPYPACQNTALGVAYDLTITRDAAPDNNKFTVLAEWDRAGGGTREQLSMVYKMYPRTP